MSRSRGTKKSDAERVRESGRRLTEWLNSRRSKGHPAREAITLTKALMRDAPELTEYEDVEHYKRKIYRITAKYPVVFVPTDVDLRPPLRLFFGLKPLGKRRGEIAGSWVVNDLRILAEAGELWRIRRCMRPKCDLFFSARFPHQVFHDGKCKERYKRSSRRFKEKRNEDYLKSLPPWKREKLKAKRARREARLLELGGKRKRGDHSHADDLPKT